MAESINASDTGITASMIKDSSAGATPYKLLLTSTETGVENTISVTNSLAASSANAIQPTFDFGNPVQAAENAQVTLGSGAGAISVESANNRFDSLIEGVTLDLLNVSDGKEVTVTVAQNTDDAVSAVQDLVTSFNSVMSFIDERSTYNEDSEEGGVLLGNRSAIRIQEKLRSAIISVVPGVTSGANRLSAIGVSVAASLDSILDELLDPITGGLKTIDERFDTESESLKESRDRQQTLFDLQRETLIREFVALETSLSELKSTGDFLTTQLASLNAARNKK
ncbi:MAG: flagellar filament capping protein FliD [Fuerstiella sp.]